MPTDTGSPRLPIAVRPNRRESSIEKILLQLDGDRIAGVFDTVMACDAGIDRLVRVGGVSPADVRSLVHDALFARTTEGLKHLAVFVGGSDVARGEAIFQAVQDSFFGSMHISVMLDANGCNTTAAALLAKVLSTGQVRRQKAVVLGGTGPVGGRTAGMLAREGAEVTITSRDPSRAQAAATHIEDRFGVRVGIMPAATVQETARALHRAEVVLATGAPGASLLPERLWRNHPTLRVLADVNAVPPLGIEGAGPSWDGERRGEQVFFGALAIGNLKKRVHYACLARMFESDSLLLDAEEMLAMAKELESRCAR
jgi:hypothetical protein